MANVLLAMTMTERDEISRPGKKEKKLYNEAHQQFGQSIIQDGCMSDDMLLCLMTFLYVCWHVCMPDDMAAYPGKVSPGVGTCFF